VFHGVAAALVTNGGITSSLYQAWVVLGLFSHLSFFKLVIKPHSLLLETRRQTSREGHNQTSALQILKLL